MWAAAARGIEPIILSVGAAFAAIGLESKSKPVVALFEDWPKWIRDLDFENDGVTDEQIKKYKRHVGRPSKEEMGAKEEEEHHKDVEKKMREAFEGAEEKDDDEEMEKQMIKDFEDALDEKS